VISSQNPRRIPVGMELTHGPRPTGPPQRSFDPCHTGAPIRGFRCPRALDTTCLTLRMLHFRCCLYRSAICSVPMTLLLAVYTRERKVPRLSVGCASTLVSWSPPSTPAFWNRHQIHVPYRPARQQLVPSMTRCSCGRFFIPSNVRHCTFGRPRSLGASGATTPRYARLWNLQLSGRLLLDHS